MGHPWPLKCPISCPIHPFSSLLSLGLSLLLPLSWPCHSSLYSQSLSPERTPFSAVTVAPRPDLFPSPTTWTCPAEPAGHKALAPSLTSGPIGSSPPSGHARTFWDVLGSDPTQCPGPAPFLPPGACQGPLAPELPPAAGCPPAPGHLCGLSPGHQPELSCSEGDEGVLGAGPLQLFLGARSPGAPPWRSGEGLGQLQVPGAPWRRMPLCPAPVPRLQLEPGLSLSRWAPALTPCPGGWATGSPCPLLLARPAPGQHPLWLTDPGSRGSAAHPAPGPANAGGHPTPGPGPWVGPRQPRPFGHCGLEAWLPEPLRQARRTAGPVLALLATSGSLEASGRAAR